MACDVLAITAVRFSGPPTECVAASVIPNYWVNRMIPMACSYKPAHPYPLNDIEFQAELLTDRRGERSYGSRLNVKKLRAAALRDRECAIASKRAARIAHRFRPASPSRGNRRSMVSLEESQRSAAVAVYALVVFA